MMNVNMRTKLVALALSLGVLTSSNVALALSNPVTGMAVSNKKVLAASALMVTLMAMKVRLDTKPTCGCEFDYDVMKEDFNDVLRSYNLFDAESRATVMNFIDKYLVGFKFKKEEKTTRTKKDDGTVCTLKGSKVVQKPSGAMGLVDAYVFTQAEGLTKLVATMAGLYVLINYPNWLWSTSVDKLMTGFSGPSGKGGDQKNDPSTVETIMPVNGNTSVKTTKEVQLKPALVEEVTIVQQKIV